MTVAPVIGEHDHQHPEKNITCIICGQRITLATATAGSLYANGTQAFACSYHITDRSEWITAWALFDNEQFNTPYLEFAR